MLSAGYDLSLRYGAVSGMMSCEDTSTYSDLQGLLTDQADAWDSAATDLDDALDFLGMISMMYTEGTIEYYDALNDTYAAITAALTGMALLEDDAATIEALIDTLLAYYE